VLPTTKFPKVYGYDGKQLTEIDYVLKPLHMGTYYVAVPEGYVGSAFAATDDGTAEIRLSYYDPQKRQWFREKFAHASPNKAERGGNRISTATVVLTDRYPAYSLDCWAKGGVFQPPENSVRINILSAD
jgi:hypothetical protein